VRTPVSLRIARLLLVAAAAGAFGVFAYIAALARSFSVPLIVFLPSGVALAYAARSLGTDLRRGRLLAIAGGRARFELDVLPLVIVFAGAGLLALGIATLRTLPVLGLTSLAIGATVAVVVLLGRPTVECHANGVSTTQGPWWLPQAAGSSSGGSSTVSGSGSGSGSIRGTVSGSGTGSPSASSGEIRRGDGIVIRYRCGGNEVVEFAIERP